MCRDPVAQVGLETATERGCVAQHHPHHLAALDRGRIIHVGRDKLVHAIDAATGKKAWTFKAEARIDSSPAIANGRAYIGSSDGRSCVFDIATGAKQWECETGSGFTSSPAIAAGRVIIASTDGVIYCFG